MGEGAPPMGEGAPPMGEGPPPMDKGLEVDTGDDQLSADDDQTVADDVHAFEKSLAALAAQLRGEEEGDMRVGLAELAQALSTCDEETETVLCRLIDESGVLPPLIERLAHGEADEHILYLALSAIVNLADVGGSELCLRHGAFQLLLQFVRSPEPNARYYACAGVQNLTADAFLVAAFQDDLDLDLAEVLLAAALESDGSDQSLAHICRCATGALANLLAVPAASEYTRSVSPSVSNSFASNAEGDEVSDSQGECLSSKLQRSVVARLAYEREVALRESAAVVRVQRRQRERVANRTPEARETEAGEERPPAGAHAVEAARKRVRAASDAAAVELLSDRVDMDAYTGRVQPAMLALARQLSGVVGVEEELFAVECVRESGVLGPLILLLVEHMQGVEKKLVYLGLSVIVNLADCGGAGLVHAHGGLELLLGLLRSDDLSLRYYAVAGVQNLSFLPVCALRVRGTGAERLLEAMLDSSNQQIARCATGALANIRRASRALREQRANAMAEGVSVSPPNAGRIDRSASLVSTRPGAVLISVSQPTYKTLPHTGAGPAPAAAASGGGSNGLSALNALAALPVSGMGLLYTVASLPFRSLFGRRSGERAS